MLKDNIAKFHIDDWDPNLFQELKNLNAVWDPINYSFHTSCEKTKIAVTKVINFYREPYKLMTKSQRSLRDKLCSEINEDLYAKRVGNKIHFCNTNGLSTVTIIKAKLIKLGYNVVEVVNDNRVVIELNL